MFNKRQLASVLAVCVVICTATGTQSNDAMTAVPDSLLTRTLFLDAAVRGNVNVVVGDRGTILVSLTGQAWQRATTPTETTLTSVYFHNDTLGWAAGHDAVILKTADGGRQWRQVYSDPDSNSPILDIWFADAMHGIAIGAYGLFLVTTDGGETWIKDEMHISNQHAGDTAPGNASASVTYVNTGEPFDLHLNAIARAQSGDLYIVAEGGHIYRSEDLGRTWQELPSPYYGSLFGILALGPDSLLVFGLRGHLYRSDDTGKTWKKIESHTSEMLTSALQLRNDRVMLTGMGGMVLISNDQGLTFAATELSYKHGYAAAIDTGDGGMIIVGDHGIEHWNYRDLGLPHD